MEEHLDNLRLELTQPRRRKPGTIATYLSTASIFLTWLGDRIPPSRQDFLRWFAWQEDQGISARTRGTRFQQLKRLYKACGWTWEFESVDKPIPEEEPFTPAFTPDEVRLIISKIGEYTKQQAFYLAISTIWGRRSEEMGRVTPKDIKDGMITFDLAKKRIPTRRTYIIPESVAPYLSQWRPRKRSSTAVCYNFREMMERSGLGPRPHWGWHSFRRTLLTMLMIELAKGGYPPSMAADYMGWSKTTIGQQFYQSAMVGVYTHPEIMSSDPYELDRIVHSVHPFLGDYDSNENRQVEEEDSADKGG